jgi:hypothetical protein
MSVSLYHDDDLAGLHKQLGGGQSVGLALTALAIANRAAFQLTYADAGAMERPNLDAEPRELKGWTATDRVNSLLYNCVTNAGTDFAEGLTGYVRVVTEAAERADRRAA